jgi:hypothetical protein
LADLGPGVRQEGAIVSRELTYYVSPRWGMSAIDTLCGRMYRFSVDPAKPKSIRGTLDFKPDDPPISAEGLVTYGPDRVVFMCGGGAFSFISNALSTDPAAAPAVREAEKRAGVSILQTHDVVRRLQASVGERTRLAITDTQMDQIRKLTIKWTKADAKQLSKLFKQFYKAELGPDRKTAARPLLHEAASLGEKWSADAEAYLRAFHAVLTDAQWQALAVPQTDMGGE